MLCTNIFKIELFCVIGKLCDCEDYCNMSNEFA